MIELGRTAAPAGGSAVKDTTDQQFMADVVEASREVPVIVDFWAPWCGPCKTLGPMLEEAVKATRGKVRMVKVNVDENQMVAQQLRVQSIPAVFAFVDGQPVDGFMGAVSGSEIKRFVESVAKMGDAGAGIDEALEQAETLLAQGQVQEAGQILAAILREDPENARALAGMIRAMIAAGDLDRARQLLDRVPEALRADPAIAAARAAVELAGQAKGDDETAALKARLEADPNDHQARFDLALALAAADDRQGAVDALLELFRRDREWTDGAAQTQLFKLFEAFGAKDPVAQSGRRRLSSMIFA